jgi:hypothetical protein
MLTVGLFSPTAQINKIVPSSGLGQGMNIASWLNGDLFYYLRPIAIDKANNLYVVDKAGHFLRQYALPISATKVEGTQINVPDTYADSGGRIITFSFDSEDNLWFGAESGSALFSFKKAVTLLKVPKDDARTYATGGILHADGFNSPETIVLWNGQAYVVESEGGLDRAAPFVDIKIDGALKWYDDGP